MTPEPLEADFPRMSGLPSLAVVDARGTEAATFLQGQLSNDLAGTGASRACLAGYCNPKGRLLALPLVLSLSEGGLRLILPEALVAGFLQRLRMFVLRADVTFEHREDLAVAGLTRCMEPGATTLPLDLAGLFDGLPDEAPTEVLDVLGSDDGCDAAQIVRWHDSASPRAAQRYLVVAGRELLDERTQGSSGDEAWRLGDISAGIPRIVEATREAFVPQMVNLQRVGGLSFRKGCYPGQEIVARMQYLGKLKRHMRRFRVATGNIVSAGDALVAEGDADAGRVVDAVAVGDAVELLAVVKTVAPIATLRLHDAALEPLELPYELPEPESVASADAGEHV